jgi:hypothetical protein
MSHTNQISRDLIKQAFSAIRLYRPKSWPSIAAFQQYYEHRLNVTVATQRAWTFGRSKPKDWSVISTLASDAVKIGRLNKTWLVQFLESLELSDAYASLKQELIDSHFPDVSVPSSEQFDIVFNTGAKATAMRIDLTSQLQPAMGSLGIPANRPTIALIGGARDMSEAAIRSVESLFKSKLGLLCQLHQINVIDGATNTGLPTVIGRARASINGDFPLIGIAPNSQIKLPDAPHARSNAEPLEPNHSHFVLTSGQNWEAASPFMAHLTRLSAGNHPAMAILINGGSVAWFDAWCHLNINVPVLVLRGSGRAADSFVTGLDLGDAAPDAVPSRLRQTGLLHDVAHTDEGNIVQTIKTVLNLEGVG